MEETTPQQDQNQENIWKSLGPKPEDNVWKTLGTSDPATQRANFVFKESSKRDPARAADVLRLSKLYNVSEQQADKSLEVLKQAEKYQNQDIQNLPDTNPKLSDFMTQSIDTAAATQKHLPALKQLDALYGRSPELLPVSDSVVQAEERNIAKLRAAKDWAAGRTSPQGFASIVQSAADAEAGITPPSYSSQQEMEDDYYKDQLSKRRAVESLMAGTAPLDTFEAFSAQHPGDQGGETIMSLLPFARFGPKINDALELADAKKAVAADTADDVQKHLVKQAQRLAGIQQLRGKGFVAGLAEQAAGFASMATEFGVGTGIASAASKGLGLSKAAAFFMEPAIGAATAGAPEAAQTFIQNQGEGDSTPEAAIKAARDAYANYMGAHIFGPWFAKATPEAQALIKDSMLKTIPIEGFKLPLMNAASEIMKAVGPGFAEHLKQTEIFRALSGDPEAIKSITQQVIVGAASGAAHSYKKNVGIDNLKLDAQTYAEAALKRGELLHESFSKDFPDLAVELSQHLAKDGPNEHTYVPVQAFKDYYEGKSVDPSQKAAELTGDPSAFDDAKRSGADLVIPTAAYDHGIGADPDAAKFFSNEIRPEPGAINLREAGALEKAYANGVRVPARERLVQQIVEQAKGNKVDEALAMASLNAGDQKTYYDAITTDPSVLGLSGDQIASLGAALGKARQAAKDIVNAKEQDRLDRLKGDLYDKEKARVTEQVTKEVDARKEQLALARLQGHRLPDGTPLPEDVPKIKLSRQAVEALDVTKLGTLGASKDVANLASSYLEQHGTPSAAIEALQESVKPHREVIAQVERRSAEIESIEKSLKKLGFRQIGAERKFREAAQKSPQFVSPERAAAYDEVNAVEKEIERLTNKKNQLLEAHDPNAVSSANKEIATRENAADALKALSQFKKFNASNLPEGVVSDGNSAEWSGSLAHGVALDPEEAAPMLGFNSGQDLILALSGANREQAIKMTADSLMAQKFPMGLQPAEMSLEAEKALHNREAAKLQHLTLEAIEANKLKKMVGVATRKLQPLDEITTQARQAIAKEPLQTLDPTRWLRAEQDAKRAATEAVFTTKWEDVFDKRLEALHAHEMYRAAIEAIETTGKTFAKWESLPEAGYLNNPRAYDWGQQVKNLLRKIGLVAVDPKELATMEPDFNKWAQEKLDSGQTRMESIRIDPRFAEDGFSTTPKEMTYRDVLSLKDTIDQLSMYAKEADSIVRAGKRARVDMINGEVRDNLVEAGYKPVAAEPRSTEDATPMERAISFARKADATLDSPEPFFNRMDGGKIDGPMNQLFQGYVEANAKHRELKDRFAVSLAKAIGEMPDQVRKHLRYKIQVEGMKRPLTRKEIMGAVLNGGNESNYLKFREGEKKLPAKEQTGLGDDYVGPDGKLKSVLQEAAKQLTEPEKDFAQKMIDAVNDFYGEVEKLHIWATGKPPEKIEAKQMIEAMGDRPGGYYPAMYDPRFSNPGEMQISGEIGQLIDKSWASATTDSGYRKERIKEYSAPMDLNFSRLVSHVEGMTKDIAFRPWLMDANKLINSPEFTATMREYFGSEFKNFASEWIKRSVGADANHSAASGGVLEKAMGTLRHLVTTASLGLKPAVFLHHALGIGPAIAEVGPARFAKAYGEFLSHPRESYKQAMAESDVMAHYLETSDVNARKSLDRLSGKQGLWADFQRFAMKVVPWGNMMRAVPTYYAGKAKAMSELAARGITGAEAEKLAIQSAEKTVRTTSGSGNAGDIPAIMRSDAMKMMLMFYTPGRVLYSQMKGVGHDWAKGNVNQAIFKSLWLLPFSAALHTLVSGRRPDEDNGETEAGMYAKDALLYPFGAMPMGSELAKNAYNAVTGKEVDMSVSVPLFHALEKSFGAVKKSADWFQDDAEGEAVARELFKTSGYWLGAPTEQLELTGGYLADFLRSKEDPNDVFEFAHDVLYRKPKSRR